MAGNWKMNLDHLQATHLVQKLDWTLRDAKHDYGAVEVAVLVPFTDLRSVQTLIEGDKLLLKHGAQDLSVHDAGAYTGEISGAFLSKLGCTYVAVGHSERRQYHAEDDAVVAAKVKAAYRHGLTPILCCGEGLEVRKEGQQVEHVLAQVDAALDGVSPEQVRSIVIAYEPIWAIGTGEVATPGGRAGGLFGDPHEAGRALLRRHRGRHPHPLRRFGQGGQRGRDHGPDRRGRSAGRWRLDRGGRVRVDLPLPRPRHAAG